MFTPTNVNGTTFFPSLVGVHLSSVFGVELMHFFALFIVVSGVQQKRRRNRRFHAKARKSLLTILLFKFHCVNQQLNNRQMEILWLVSLTASNSCGEQNYVVAIFDLYSLDEVVFALKTVDCILEDGIQCIK